MDSAPLRHRVAALLVLVATVALLAVITQRYEDSDTLNALAFVLMGLVAVVLLGLVVALYSAERVGGQGRARALLNSLAEAARLYFLPWR